MAAWRTVRASCWWIGSERFAGFIPLTRMASCRSSCTMSGSWKACGRNSPRQGKCQPYQRRRETAHDEPCEAIAHIDGVAEADPPLHEDRGIFGVDVDASQIPAIVRRLIHGHGRVAHNFEDPDQKQDWKENPRNQ